MGIVIYIKLGVAVLALGAMVAVDVLALPMSASVAGLLGLVVHRYLLPTPHDRERGGEHETT